MKRREIGITLIALVITIIILLILAGITISSLSNSGLFGKAKEVQKQNAMRKAEEEINLILNEWKIVSVTSNQTFKEFLDTKIESNEIDNYKIVEEGNVQIFRGSYYLIVNDEGDIIQKIGEFENKTEATYEIISTDGTNFQIQISIKNEDGIQKIICPEGNIINGNNQTKVIINDYTVERDKQYEFIIQVKDGEEKFILDVNEESSVTISGTTGAYPILTKDGVEKVGAIITIQNVQNGKCYYSLDDGNTWLPYTKEVIVYEEGNVKIKNIIDNKIVRIETKEIAMNLANDAFTINTYDKNSATYTEQNGCYMYIADNARGGELYVNITATYNYSFGGGPSSVRFYDIDGIEIEGSEMMIPSLSTYIGNISIPQNAVKFSVYHGGGYSYSIIRELDFSTVPLFDEKVLYPYIDLNGVQRDKKYKIDYHKTAVKKLYCKDNINWEDYPEDGVELAYGETLYAKSINNNGQESQVLTYTHNKSNIIGDQAYDGDYSTEFGCDARNVGKYYIYIDPEVQGRDVYIKFTARKYSEWHFKFYDDEGNLVNFYYDEGNLVEIWPPVVAPYNEGYQDGNLTIPEGVAKLEIVYTGGNGGPGSFYEIELK